MIRKRELVKKGCLYEFDRYPLNKSFIESELQTNYLVQFHGFNGYLLLGHYLKDLDWSLKKTLAIGIPMFVVGYVVTFFGFRYMTALPDCTDEMLELFFTYCSLNVVMMTIPVFMLAKKVNVRSERLQNTWKNRKTT